MPLTLIVLTGFYPAARQALRYADELASALGGRLVVLHVNRASLYDPYVLMGESWHRQELAGEADTAALLARLASQLQAPAIVELATDLLPAVAHDLAARYQPALFVLGRPAPENTSSEQLSAAISQPAAMRDAASSPFSTSWSRSPKRSRLSKEEPPSVCTSYS